MDVTMLEVMRIVGQGTYVHGYLCGSDDGDDALIIPSYSHACTHTTVLARFRLVQGVDLTGMELGSQRGTHGVAPLLKYVLDHLPAVKRLRLQVRCACGVGCGGRGRSGLDS